MAMDAGVGRGEAEDAQTAGREAAQQALQQVDGQGELGLVFASVEYDQDELIGTIDDELDMPVIGCSTGGEITGDGLQVGSVVVMVLSGDIHVSIGVGQGIGEGERQAGSKAASDAFDGLGTDMDVKQVIKRDGDWEQHTPVDLTIFSTTLTGNGSEVMRGIQQIAGNGTTAAGGLAGDDWQLNTTYVYHNGEVLEDAVVCCAIESPYRRGVGIRHGLTATEHTYRVTASEDNVVHELDGEPAADVYEDVFGPKGRTANFIMTKPLGIEAGEEELRLRDPLIVNDDGSIVYAGEIQEGSIVTIMESPPKSIIDAARDATRQAYKEAGEPDDVAAVIMHDCVCRWNCLANDTTRKKEIQAVKDVVGEETPIIGWYTYGEIALPRTLAGVHNQTLVVQLLGAERADR